jgi:signal transduction histidine kinase
VVEENGGDTSGLSPGSEIELSDAERGQLLDLSLWREGLERYAQATHLAVVLTDAAGNPVGSCLHPQPTWLVLQTPRPAPAGACPFSVMPLRPCTCIADALATGHRGLSRDRVGMVHFAVPLRLGDHRLGAVVAGQVFDRYPEQLVLEHVAQLSGVSPQTAWERARLEHPVKASTLLVYADLLATLADDRLRGLYHRMREADRLAELSRLSDQLQQARGALELRVQERTAELSRVNAVLHEAMTARTELLLRLVTAQEDERRRLSRELHDGLGQELTALILGLKSLERALPEDAPGRDRLLEVERIVNVIGREAHDLAVELRPTALDDLGLCPALSAYFARWSERTGVAAEFQPLGLDGDRLPPEVETTVYRVVQEALNNVAKHAEARRVSVMVSRHGAS